MRTSRILWFLPALIVGGLTSLPSRAEAVVLDVVADAYVEDFSSSGVLDGIPDAIYNTNTLLPARGILSSGGAIDARAILAFDLGPYAGLTLSSATLSGYGGRVDNGFLPDPITAHFFAYMGDGSVSLADFDTPAAFAADVSLPGVTQFPYNLSFFELPVTAHAQDILDAGWSYLEFRIEADVKTAYLSAGEVSPPYSPDPGVSGPRLTLLFRQPDGAAVPEPSSWLLLGLGWAGLGSITRRRSIKH